MCQGKCGDVCSFQGVSHSQSGKPVWNWLEDPGWRENGLHRLLLSGNVFKEKGAPGRPALGGEEVQQPARLGMATGRRTAGSWAMAGEPCCLQGQGMGTSRKQKE